MQYIVPGKTTSWERNRYFPIIIAFPVVPKGPGPHHTMGWCCCFSSSLPWCISVWPVFCTGALFCVCSFQLRAIGYLHLIAQPIAHNLNIILCIEINIVCFKHCQMRYWTSNEWECIEMSEIRSVLRVRVMANQWEFRGLPGFLSRGMGGGGANALPLDLIRPPPPPPPWKSKFMLRELVS